MRDLKRYRDKRHPELTPEPFGDERPPRVRGPGAPRAFVVQQHAARRLHWDLRLEIEDVLASWAVPRGPSLDPAEKRLAVRTEDHPLEYADFEGVIPAGNYGAGAMIVWDRGVYRSVEARGPAEGLEHGKLDLELQGHKLRGRFALVRTRRGEGRDWLLLRKGAPPEEPEEIVEAEPRSVLSGLTITELAEGTSREREVGEALAAAGAPAGRARPLELRPMLASTGDGPFSREGWLFELKYDGARVRICRDGQRVQLISRAGRDRTATYPELALAAAHLPLDSFVLDGEVVALDASGRSSFERLQRRFTQTDPAGVEQAAAETPVVFYAFDLLFAAGHDLRRLPLAERKRVLALFAPRLGQVRFADHVEGDGDALFRAAEEHGFEGMVAKRADSPYETGRRSKAWRKIKVPRHAPLVIVGYLEGRGARGPLGSLMLAWQRDGEWVYAGNAGSGLGEAQIEELLARLEPLRVEGPAFRGAPPAPSRGRVWVRPELVCEVGYTEVTEAGFLRHPVFRELREDLTPEDCVAPSRGELEAEAAGDGAGREPESAGDGPDPPAPEAPRPRRLELTRMDKIFWPVEGYTKGDLLGYYEAIWPWLEPYLRDRPVVLTRYPDGIEGKSFYQKNAPGFTPDWAERENIDGTDYFVCNDLRTLLYVINSGAIPLHVWSARCASIERPDWLILDLDPKQAPFQKVVELARHLHRMLDALGVRHFVKTSGQDGLHVMLPLGTRLDHAEARGLAEVIARVACMERPDLATIARPLAARGDKVYLDFLQNGRGKLIASPFSVRPRPGAPVSLPLRWGQVTVRLDPGRFTIRNAAKRMARGGDPLAGVLGEPVDVEGLLAALGERLHSKAP